MLTGVKINLALKLIFFARKNEFSTVNYVKRT